MLALTTSSTSTHAHARPKTRVGGFEHRRAPRVRARAAASRETRWGNSAEVRRSTAGLSQYFSPEPLLQSPRYVKAMAKSGMSVPTYAYAANNPLKYTDPNGLDLHVAWSNYLFYDDATIAKLQRVVDQLNAPSGACKCALTSGTGYQSTPWADRWISVVMDPSLGWRGAEGFTNPAAGIIYVDPSLSESSMTGTVAHEGGHLRFPYLGHDDFADRFGTPATMCDSTWKAQQKEYLENRPWCDCR